MKDKQLKKKIEEIIVADIIVGDDGRLMNYEQAAIDIIPLCKEYANGVLPEEDEVKARKVGGKKK